MLRIRENRLTKRTVLMTKERADAFAKCIRSNKAFTALPVHVEMSNRTNHPTVRYYVSWTPLSLEKQEELSTQFESERHKQALRQIPGYMISPCSEHDGWYFVVKLTGEFYIVSPKYGCDIEGHGCADMLYRGYQTGNKCKHFYLLNSWLETQESLRKLAEKPPKPINAERVKLPTFKRTSMTISAGDMRRRMTDV